jgi:hypothetical protein
MRRFILIAAMVLTSVTAQAGQSRNLSPVAASDQPVVTPPPAQPPKAAEADISKPTFGVPIPPASPSTPPLEDRQPTQATIPAPPAPPQFEERPPAVSPVTTTTAAPPLATPPITTPPATTQAKADAPRKTMKAGRRRRGGYWTEARIIGELHRYGIYW